MVIWFSSTTTTAMSEEVTKTIKRKHEVSAWDEALEYFDAQVRFLKSLFERYANLHIQEVISIEIILIILTKIHREKITVT